MQKPLRNGNDLAEAAMRQALTRPPQQNIPMLLDAHGNGIGVLSVTTSVTTRVMAAFEDMIRRVIREELARVGEGGVTDDSSED